MCPASPVGLDKVTWAEGVAMNWGPSCDRQDKAFPGHRDPARHEEQAPSLESWGRTCLPQSQTFMVTPRFWKHLALNPTQAMVALLTGTSGIITAPSER